MSHHRTASIYFVFQDKMHIIQENERFLEMYEDGGDDKAAGLGNRGNSAFWKDNLKGERSNQFSIENNMYIIKLIKFIAFTPDR